MNWRYVTVIACVMAVVGLKADGDGPLPDRPSVLRLSPEHGEIGVDPTLTEIRIEFDQAMNPETRSLCGGGESFPEIVGEPAWETPRVLLLPVKLRPGRRYRMSINCSAAQNFRSATGEAAQITPYTFATAAIGEKPTVTPILTVTMVQETIDRLREAIDTRYSYRDRVVHDWPDVMDRLRSQASVVKTPAMLARMIARELAASKDLHLSVSIGEAKFPVYAPEIQRNVDIARLKKTIPDLRQPTNEVMTGRWSDGIGYIFISTWPGEKAEIRQAFDALDEMADCRALIIDVRHNGGGDERTARKFAEHFVTIGAVYSLNRFRDATESEGWTTMLERVIQPLGKGDEAVPPGAMPFRGSVAVLMGPGCMSSNESFLLMMRHGGHATLIGSPSFGTSGNPRAVDVGHGITVSLPAWQDYLPDGTLLEGRGVQPDVPAALGEADEDGVIAEALKLLRGGLEGG